MRILGLDYGSRTIGVAVTDELGLTAQPLETIVRPKENHLRRSLARIEYLCGALQIEKIVLGLPLNMDDTEGERALLTRSFGEMVAQRTGLPVVLEDERLTTAEAEEILEAAGVRREDRKKTIDQMAASLILQSYLGKENSYG